MHKSTSVHLDDDDQIECVHQISEHFPDGYPILMIHANNNIVNSLDIFSTMDRLRRLHSVIGAYLAAHDEEPDGSADRADIVPAEATEKVYVIEEGSHGVTWGVEERPIAAEACCGDEELPEGWKIERSIHRPGKFIVWMPGDTSRTVLSFRNGEPRYFDSESAALADVRPLINGQVIDADDLLHSMSMDFERREEWADPTDAEIAAGVRTAPRSGF